MYCRLYVLGSDTACSSVRISLRMSCDRASSFAPSAFMVVDGDTWLTETRERLVASRSIGVED